MHRFIIYIQNSKYYPSDIDYVMMKSRQLCSQSQAKIHDIRISNFNLELDISINNLDQKLIKTLQHLGNITRIKHVIDEKMPKDDAIKKGQNYFNNEYFWECHEVLESVWKNCYGVEKNLLQGIILTAAAFVHYQKNENTVCMSILNRASKKLLLYHYDFYYEINIKNIKINIQNIIKHDKILLFTI